MKFTKIVCISAVLSLFVVQANAQKDRVVAADKKYDSYAYVDAIATYEKVAKKGYKDEKMFQKLGNAYYFNADLEKAVKWYDELFAMNQDQEAEYCYRYAQSLKAVGDYEKADKIMDLFSSKSVNDQRAKLYANNKDYLALIKKNSGRYVVTDAGVNTEYYDYGSTIIDNKLVFSSSRKALDAPKKVSRWTDQIYFNLYSAEIKSDGNFDKANLFNKEINSKFDESTPVFTKDGQTMYFTRTNYLKNKKGKDLVSGKDGTVRLKIYRATLENGKWGKVKELPFNSSEYNVAHPALSKDGKILYFASDMPGTFGQADIFRVEINSDGTFGAPENLGKLINTQGRETFPFISKKNELFYASDGHPGLGGLDIFVSKMEEGGIPTVSQNVGEPINGRNDDFGYYIDTDTKTGFFTSNRKDGHGFDDIYKFNEIEEVDFNQYLAGTITDKETGKILPDSKVSLFDDKFKLLEEGKTNENGQYKFKILGGKTYYVRAEKQDYETKEDNIVTAVKGDSELNLALEQRMKAITVGSDLAKTFGIKEIYFDLDKSFIRKDAAMELEKILAVLQQYPKMEIDIRSHTDSRQTHRYNEGLSDRRAKSTMAWLIEKGVEKSRLTAKGYGETQLVNKCADGVQCTDEEHQANRRSEFIITKM